jgi:hypothetical protein
MNKHQILLSFLIPLLLNSCSDIKLEPKLVEEVSEIHNTTKSGKNGRLSDVCSLEYGFDDYGKPIGGGNGYSGIVDKSSADVIVYNLAELIAALDTATNPSIIYIEDTVVIDIPAAVNQSSILYLKEGVTLASGRGNGTSCGALIKTDVYKENNNDNSLATRGYEIFRFSNDDGRITGIRFEGPFGGIGDTRPSPVGLHKLKTAINTYGQESITIDNCEFYNWPKSAITVSGGSYNNIKILNNDFHSNKQAHYGYGISVSDGFAQIKGNLFYNNRHDIAGTGAIESGYEASYNYIMGDGTSHHFDMHGGDNHDTGTNIAGKYIHIHNNIFADDANLAIKVRGIPTFMCLIENNKFNHASIYDAVGQFRSSRAQADQNPDYYYKENILAWNNIYDWDGLDGSYLGWFASRVWDKQNAFANIPFEDKIMMDFQLGDFDNDDETEIFKIKDGEWYLAEIPLENSAINSDYLISLDWDRINYAPSFTFQIMRFGDFDGDGSTDVFKSNNQDWYISKGGQTTWTWINHAPGFTVDKIRFGDFDGNGSTDVFKANGQDWHVSWGGQTTWEDINTSGFTIANLAFGDFNNNGTTDVFKSNNQDWYISEGGQTVWTWIKNAPGFNISTLMFADINNDGAMDVLTNLGTHYEVSLGGSSELQELSYQHFPSLLASW